MQRVKRCEVTVGGEPVASTGEGLLVLLGVACGDAAGDVDYLVDKVLNLRIFADEEGKMNLSLLEAGGEMTVVSQFTLLADTRKGRRPSFAGAAPPQEAEPLYELFVERARAAGVGVATGLFGEMMTVSLDNWGPVTIIIDS